MSFKLAAPLVQTYKLEQTDARYGDKSDSPTTVTIKQATQLQHEHRQQIFATLERKYDDLAPDVTTLVQKANIEELKRIEVKLTMIECNITQADGKKPLFPSKKGKDGLPELDMTDDEFRNAWGLLPPDVATEIHDKVVQLNTMWGPLG